MKINNCSRLKKRHSNVALKSLQLSRAQTAAVTRCQLIEVNTEQSDLRQLRTPETEYTKTRH